MLKLTPGLPVEQPKPPKAPKPDKKAEKAESGDLGSILSAIRKEKGDQVAVAASAIPRVERLETGVFEFDFNTGGGFPFGRYSIVYGAESSGKTNICLRAAARAQKRPAPCNKVVWINLEQTFDPAWAALMGVDVDNLIVINPAYGEEAVDIFDAVVRASDVAAVFVDSLAALVPSREIARSTEDADVGSASLLIKRLANKLMIAFGEEARRGHYPAVVFINQIRFKIGVMFGNPETMPGGEAIKFLCSLRVRLSASNKIVKEVNPNVHAFKETHCIVKKSKVPVLSNDFKYDHCVYAHDGLAIGDSRSWPMVMNHLKQLGSLSKSKDGWETQGCVFPTLAAAEERYLDDEEFRIACQRDVIEAHAGQAILVDEPPAKSFKQQPGIPIAVNVGGSAATMEVQ